MEVWFAVQRDLENYPDSQGWEQLWTWKTIGGYCVDNIPFFVKGVAVGDIVSASRGTEGWLQFDTVIKQSGNSTFRIWLSESKARFADQALDDLRGLGCQVELTLGRLIAIDVPRDREERVWAYLQRGLERGEWDLQVACSPD